ncbi:MAG: IPT/TIG domain-containing protein [Treponema sp.]|nr:IPT/TIG domain-containing protein [Treponema sp.]
MRITDTRKFLFFLIQTVFLLALLTGCRERVPEITSLEPRIGLPGDILTIRGDYFGKDQGDSYVTIAGTPPTTSSYISWDDTEIRVKVPEFGEAGLVYVHRGRTSSNPLLFANRATLPEKVQGPESGNAPLISSVDPPSGAIGSLIVIQGNNFGSSRENGGVYFSWNAESSPAAPADTNNQDSVEVFETEFGYELWSEREIRVRVPDGAISGNLEVRTSRGKSRPVYMEIAGKPGTKTFKDKKSYTFSYMVDLQIDQAASPNNLYIWMPQPVVSSSQRNIQLLSRNAQPFVENFRGTSLFQFIDVQPKARLGINLSFVAEVYAVETSIKNQAPVKLNTASQAGIIYTLPSTLVPSDDPNIKAKAMEITGKERYPFGKAQKIYEWLVSSAGIDTVPLTGGAIEALEEKRADSYRASLLFCALARAANIPAIPVAGVLVNRQMEATRHYWAEFWLDGFGWVPLDPTLGAGAAPQDFNLRDDRAKYYFGNLDSQRITFTRGECFLTQMTPRGRTAYRTRDYSLQNLWEEAAGGLESYSSLWSNVTITGIYAQ